MPAEGRLSSPGDLAKLQLRKVTHSDRLHCHRLTSRDQKGRLKKQFI